MLESDDEAVRLGDADVSGWRRRVAWLPQHAHLAAADLSQTPSIAEAVRLRDATATDDEVWRALRDAGIADEVRALPDGLRTRLAADGSGLSAGQMQRLSLARALLTPADVFLLDEPTAALDPSTEAAVVSAIERLASGGATVIVVAHRPALVEIAHQVIRLDRPPAGDADEEMDATAPRAAQTIRGTGW